jgi:hypothetical protein
MDFGGTTKRRHGRVTRWWSVSPSAGNARVFGGDKEAWKVSGACGVRGGAKKKKNKQKKIKKYGRTAVISFFFFLRFSLPKQYYVSTFVCGALTIPMCLCFFLSPNLLY